MKNLIITIGRQFGSGGRDVGEAVAKALDIPFYDKELVEIAAQKSNIHKEAVENIDEKATSSFLYSLAAGNYTLRGINAPLYYEMPINDKLFIAQSEVIKEIATKGSAVIVGRCADYVLEDSPYKTANIFIYAPHEFRAKRVAEKFDIPMNKAKDRINKADKQRRTYYDYYTNGQWGVMANYDLCINTESVGIEGAVELVKDFAKLKSER